MGEVVSIELLFDEHIETRVRAQCQALTGCLRLWDSRSATVTALTPDALPAT